MSSTNKLISTSTPDLTVLEEVNEMVRGWPRHFLCKGSAADVWLYHAPDSRDKSSPPVGCSLAVDMTPQKIIKKVMRVKPESFKNTSRSRSGDMLLALRQNFEKNYSLWMSLSHPNITRVRFVIQDELTLLQEYCSSGDLRKCIKQGISEIGYIRIITDVLSGLTYLHGLVPPIVHGCINPGKIYLAGGIAKLGEFGLSQLAVDFPHLAPSISVAGMARWTSPEYLVEPHPGPTTQGDIWSFGCTLLELATGFTPYHQSEHDTQVLVNIMKGMRPGNHELVRYMKGKTRSLAFIRLVENFITQCWLPPEKRPCSQALLEQAYDSFPTSIPSTINASMSLGEIFSCLVGHGCGDVTPRLDISSISKSPVSTGRSSGFADVYRGRLKDGTPVALKLPRAGSLQAAHELYIWSRCNHPNVLWLIGAAVYDGRIALVTHWMEHGDLASLFQRDPTAMPDRLNICVQVAESLSYLHSAGIIHGCVKGANILVWGGLVPMIGDFSQASFTLDDGLFFERVFCPRDFNLRWTAPEVFIEEIENTFKSDVYSLGMTILEIITGEVPWAGTEQMAIPVRKAGNPIRPRVYFTPGNKRADLTWNLLQQCWDQDPNNRPTATEVRDRLKNIMVHAEDPFVEIARTSDRPGERARTQYLPRRSSGDPKRPKPNKHSRSSLWRDQRVYLFERM